MLFVISVKRDAMPLQRHALQGLIRLKAFEVGEASVRFVSGLTLGVVEVRRRNEAWSGGR